MRLKTKKTNSMKDKTPSLGLNKEVFDKAVTNGLPKTIKEAKIFRIIRFGYIIGFALIAASVASMIINNL